MSTLSATATPARGTVVVLGFMFWYPMAGVAYQFLHYMLGLKKLGYDVYYVEDALNYVYDPASDDRALETDPNVQAVRPILERAGFADKWSFRVRFEGVDRVYGMSRPRVAELLQNADALLNVTGWNVLSDEHMACATRIYVESDPFSLQVDLAQGNEEAVAIVNSHTHLFSFGENIGQSDCTVPSTGRVWLPTRQPVSMELWSNPFPPGAKYNTITTWQNSNKHREYNGELFYWTKNREFEKFLDLPLARKESFEMATRIDHETAERLRSFGWHVAEALPLSLDVDRYREYIQRSRAEFTVARDQYVRPRTGWFSDRTATYLAAGRPVITQDTAFARFIPTGTGLFAFSTMEDIHAAIDAIESNYALHARAAEEIAAEYFAAEKVLASLLGRAGV